MFKSILWFLLLLPFYSFSQEIIEKKGLMFKTDTMDRYTYVGIWGQNIEPYLQTSSSSQQAFKQFKTGRIVASSAAGLAVVGVSSMVISIVASDQTSCDNSSWCFFPDIDDNKIWLLGFGSVAVMTGLVVSPTAGIIARGKLKKSVRLHNAHVTESLGMKPSSGIPFLLQMDLRDRIGVKMVVEF